MATDRRNMLSTLLGSSLALSVVTLVAPIFAYLAPLPSSRLGTRTLEDQDGDPIHPDRVREGTGIVGRLSGRPTLVIRKNGQLLAFVAVCPHLGCVVRWNDRRGSIECPCHGGRFDLEGQVIAGPPPQDLSPVPVQVLNDRILLA